MVSFQTQSENEAQKAQEWAKNNPNAKFGNKTVQSVLHDTKEGLNGILKAIPEKGKIEPRLQDAIQIEIDKDVFIKSYLSKKLGTVTSPSARARQGFNEMLEIQAYLGIMSHFQASISRLAGEARKYIANPVLSEQSKIVNKFSRREIEYNSLPDVGKARLQTNFTALRDLVDQVRGTSTPAAPIAPNIIGSRRIGITSSPHSERIGGSIQPGESLWVTKDGINWSPVPIDTSNNFDIPISETTNGTYTYTFRTKNATGVESGEETVTVDINVVLSPVAPRKPNISSGATFTTNTPTIEGDTTPGSEVVISSGGITVGREIADASGNFSITTSALPDGTHRLKIEASNPADPTKKDHDNQSITINTAPIAPTEPTLTNTDYTVDPPEIEGRTTPNVDVEVTINGAVHSCRSNTSGVFKVRPGTALGSGTYPIQIVARNGGVSSTTLTENITIRRPLSPADLRSFTIPSLEIEQGTTNPKLTLGHLKEGTKITIFDRANRQISDEFEVPAGTTNEDIDLLTISTEYPGEQGIIIKVEDMSGGLPPYIDRSKKIKITHRKITYVGNVTGSITSRVDRDGKIPFGSQVTTSINNIPKGAKLRVVGPTHRLRGAAEIELGHWGNDSTKFSGVVDIDTKIAPFDTEEELDIEIYDPNSPHDAALIKKVTPPIKFKIAQEEAVLNHTNIQAPVGKIKNGNDAIFRINRPNNDTEIIVEPGGTVFDVAILTPPEIRISGITTAGKHTYSFYIQDKNHRGKPRELMGTYEIEVDHPELTLTPPVVPTTPIRCTQGGSKPSVTLSGLVPGSEVVLTGPNGELTKFIATTTSKTIALTRLDISQSGIPQDIHVQVNDPHHANIPPEMNTFQIEVEKKKEAPKHLPQPVFKTPVDYAEGGGDIDIELLNAVTHSEVTATYNTAGGPTTTTPLTVTADGNLKLPLAGFDAPAGTTNITVNYRNPVTSAVQSRTIPMNIAPRPAIERPEGLQDETDINTKPIDVKIGKIKPGQTISVAGNTEMLGGAASVPATLRNNGGTYVLNIPAGAQSIKQNYTVTVSDASGATESFAIIVNVKVPPKANRRITHHNFSHACKEAKESGVGQYRINGEGHAFDITKSWGRKFSTTIHGDTFKAKTPDELYKKVKEHLDHENEHEKDEYNAYWGLMPESSAHTPEDSEKGKESKEKGKEKDEKEKGDKKDEHKKEAEHSGSTFDKIVGYMGKKIIGAKNMIPARKFIKGSVKSSAFMATGFGAVGLIGGAPLLPAFAAGAAVGLVGYTGYRLWRAFFPGKKEEEAPHHA